MTVINVWGNHLRLWKISYYSIFLLSLKSSWGMGNIPKPKGHKPVELFSSIFSFLKINYSLVLLRFEMLSSVLTNFYNVFYLNFHNYYLCNVHMSTSLFCHYQCFQGSRLAVVSSGSTRLGVPVFGTCLCLGLDILCWGSLCLPPL